MEMTNEILMTKLQSTYGRMRINTASGIMSSIDPDFDVRDYLSKRKNSNIGRLATMQFIRDKRNQYKYLMQDLVLMELLQISGTNSSENINESKLAKYLKTDVQALSSALESLEREGFINCSKYIFDKHKRNITLTEKGQIRANELQTIKAQKNEEFLKPLSSDEKETLIKLLDKLHVANDFGL